MKQKLKITLNAPFTLSFALLCGLATLLCAVFSECRTLLFSTYRAPLSDPLMYLRLFTHVLGHIDLAHLIGNMTLFLLLGPALEEKYGASRLLIVILAAALITGIIHNLFFPSMLLGASRHDPPDLLHRFPRRRDPRDLYPGGAPVSGTAGLGRHHRPGQHLKPLAYPRRSGRFRSRMAPEQKAPEPFLT